MPIDYSLYKGSFKEHNGQWVYIFPDIINIVRKKQRVWNVMIHINNLHNTELYNNNFYHDKKCIALVWTEYYIIGEDIISKSEPTKVLSGKNIGKINETNVFTQALIVCNSLYNKKLDSTGNRISVSIGNVDSRIKLYYPQACHKFEDVPVDEKKQIICPFSLQTKIDGIRCVSLYTEGKVYLYSRKLKQIPLKHIEEQLLVLYNGVDKNVYLDGELYKHGLNLQEVSSLVKNQTVKSDSIEYHIFDLFIPSGYDEQKDMPFIERIKIVNNLQKIIDDNKLDKIKIVKTHHIKDFKSGDKLYHKLIKNGYEGVILKNNAGVYEFSKDKEIRSYQIRKRKPRHSGEYKIIGYKCGTKGKEENALIWELETKNGHTFTSVPIHISTQERIEMYNKMTPAIFELKYKNKMMTVEYDDLSEDTIPLRAKAICVREID